MLIDNFAIAPPFTWGSRIHFPLSIFFLYDPTLEIKKFSVFSQEQICPNPSNGLIKITTKESVKSLLIFDYKVPPPFCV